MREVGPRVALERFELVAEGAPYGVVEIVDGEVASIVLTAMPEFPLDIAADRARQFVAAWSQHANLEAQPYEVRQEQREV